MAKSVVSISKGTDPEKMVEEALSHLGGVESLITPGSTVVIKPNAIGMYESSRSVTTSPPFVSAVIKVLRKAKPKKIIMAESSAMSRNTIECLKKSGIYEAAEKAGVDEIKDIKQDKDLIKLPIRDHRSDLKNLMLPRFIIEADHIVNLPIFKCHVSAVFSCCMKNIKGLVQDKIHYQMHQTDLIAAIMDAWSVIRPDLQIVDMIRPLEGYGPIGGIPMDFGCMVAGKDPAAVDATACRMVGLPLDKTPYFEQVAERNIGKFKEKDIEVRGEKIKDVFRQMWLPHLDAGAHRWPEYNIHSEGSCSSCQALLAYGMERLKSLGEYEKNAGATIVLGRPKELPKDVKPEDLILMGDCVKKYRDKGIFIEGCPPLEMQPTWTIADRRYDTPDKWTRVYSDEVNVFLDYARKERAKWAAEEKPENRPDLIQAESK